MLTIYGRANSSNVRKVLWVADEIGVPYNREDWGRGFRPLSEPAFQKLSHHNLVPVIDDAGFVLRESNTICRYLAAKHGRHDLYPTDLQQRAKIEAFMDWVSADLTPQVRPVFFGITLKADGHTDPTQIQAGIEGWGRVMRTLDRDLAVGGGKYLMGDTFTLADVPAGIYVNRWFTIPFLKPDLPNLARYYDALTERPAYRTHGRNGTP